MKKSFATLTTSSYNGLAVSGFFECYDKNTLAEIIADTTEKYGIKMKSESNVTFSFRSSGINSSAFSDAIHYIINYLLENNWEPFACETTGNGGCILCFRRSI